MGWVALTTHPDNKAMLKIINEISFNCSIEDIANQIAGLLNKNNKLKIHHTSATIKEDNGTYIVYLNGKDVIGCTAIRKEAPNLYRSYHTSVAEEYRKKGVGTLLLTEATKLINTEYSFATIINNNYNSINLYKRHGYVYVRNETQSLILMGRRHFG